MRSFAKNKYTLIRNWGFDIAGGLAHLTHRALSTSQPQLFAMQSSLWRPAHASPGTQRGLIYFICGNPGLVEFYADFLDALRGLLDSTQSHTAYDIYGRNLLGFSDDDHEPFGPASAPFDVNAQIEAMYADVAARGTDGKDAAYDFVILTGHSIGAYICVEIFHRHMQDPSRFPELRLRHGFLLFPTIASIAKSDAGQRLTFLRGLPSAEENLHTYAKALLSLLPQALLQWVVCNIMGFTPQTAVLTAQWLKSRDGVHQALHMGKCEMDEVLEDMWADELWQASTLEGKAPRFFLFYGRKDHWVADHVRDEFIARRRGMDRAPSIVVDEGDIPHAFCTRAGKFPLLSTASLTVLRRVLEGCEDGALLGGGA